MQNTQYEVALKCIEKGLFQYYLLSLQVFLVRKPFQIRQFYKHLNIPHFPVR